MSPTTKITLKSPGMSLCSQELPCVSLDAATLIRITSHNSGEPYFGNRGLYRFDDPLKTFGTCYVATEFLVAFAETVLHDEEPEDGGFLVGTTRIANKYFVKFNQASLNIVDLTGPNLKRLGATAELSATSDYSVPQAWSQAIQQHKQDVDGFQYVSRHCNTLKAIVLFDRAKPKLKNPRYQPLSEHPEFKSVLQAFNVTLLNE